MNTRLFSVSVAVEPAVLAEDAIVKVTSTAWAWDSDAVGTVGEPAELRTPTELFENTNGKVPVGLDVMHWLHMTLAINSTVVGVRTALGLGVDGADHPDNGGSCCTVSVQFPIVAQADPVKEMW
jgi:hypothetical protein